MNDDERALVIYKIGITRGIISRSNTMAFIPFDNTMYFSIPQEYDHETQEMYFLTISVPAQHLVDNIRGDTFVFDNSVWNALAEASVTSANQDNEVYRTTSEVIYWQLSNLAYEGCSLYTMFSPEKWAEMLDPVACASAVMAIRENVITNID